MATKLALEKDKGERALELEVEQMLRGARIDFAKKVVVGDCRPDFVVTTEEGGQIVVEVKGWGHEPKAHARALHQAKRYKELSKAGGALVVTPGVPFDLSSATVAITPLHKMLSSLATLSTSMAKSKKNIKLQPTHPTPKKKVFASMPFAGVYDDTFMVAIAPASLTNKAIAERVDHSGAAGPVVPQIYAMIKGARVVVADLSDSRPNVLHEVGYAEGMKTPVIQICSTSIANLPFNVRNNHTIPYSIGQTAKLKKALESEIAKYM
ncbi:MAG TPA: hypothetical protein VLL54_15855 [Pyrinomonadaceae bacterium]|nr:hypothetical protein [Pyrinomonadaceae bacterium]